MSFTIEFDYRFDHNGFFDDPDRRAILEAAAAIWEDIILDEFDDVPVGTSFLVDDPSDSGNVEEVVLDAPIDDILIFVGAEDLGGPLAFGGYDGTSTADGFGLGDIFGARVSGDFRGQGPVTDVEPWVGTIAYDSEARWSFDLDGAVAGRTDFLTVTLHEIGHVLGVGTAPIFDAIGAGGMFDGFNALVVNDGEPIPLQHDLGHVESGFDGDSVLMDPILTRGVRVLPSDIDKALLADIGYEIDGFVKQGETPALATEDGESIFGTATADMIDGLAGDDRILGKNGDDTLLGGVGDDTLFGEGDDDLLSGGTGENQLQGGTGDDTLMGGSGDDRMFGQDGVDTFHITGGGGQVWIGDFDVANERILIEGSGFANAEAVLEAFEAVFTSRVLTFADGTELSVQQFGFDVRELTLANIQVLDPILPPETLEGGPGDDRLTGTDAAEALLGLAGNDTLNGLGEADTLDGGAGIDTWITSDGGGVTVDLEAGEAIGSDGAVDDLISIERAEGAAGDDVLLGDDGANLLRGRAGDDTLDGRTGTDTLDGGTGDDVLFVDRATDRIVERVGEGQDTIFASGDVMLRGAEVETVFVTATGGVRVTGNAFATDIVGGAGGDILIGGGGGDTLTGGAGVDYFAFLESDARGAATITDFGPRDILALDDRYFGLGDAGIDARLVTADQIRGALSSGQVIYDAATGLLQMDVDGARGPADAFDLAQFEPGTILGLGDLLLF